MKKIIATVLAMVMALALCTTAFAASITKNEVESKDYTLKTMANADKEIGSEKIAIEKRDAEKTTVGSETTTKYFADKYTMTLKGESTETTLYACDASIANYKLIDKAGKIVYLNESNKLADAITDVVTKMIEGKGDDAKGTDYVKDVYIIDGKAYEVGGDKVAMFNGLAVLYGDKADVKGYTLVNTDKTPADKTKLTYNAKGEVTGITAAEGDKTFEVVKKVPTSYTGDTEELKIAKADGKFDTYYILLGNTVTPSGTTTGTTTSPKTFDAGIAMYVGMALTSVAGSAVVIGKKKEF